MWNGVSPLTHTAKGSDFSCSRICTIFKAPARAATCKGVSPFSSLAATLAPHFSSTCADRSPFGTRAAMCSGVSPFFPPKFTEQIPAHKNWCNYLTGGGGGNNRAFSVDRSANSQHHFHDIWFPVLDRQMQGLKILERSYQSHTDIPPPG